MYTYDSAKELLILNIIDFFNPTEIISIKRTANFSNVINFPRCCKIDISRAKLNINIYVCVCVRKIECYWRKAHIP